MSEPTMDEVKMTFEILQKKLADKSWTDAQDPEFIVALNRIDNTFQQMGAQIYIFISYFEQYVEAIHSSPLFASAPVEDKNDNEYSPTQTFSAPADEVAE